MAKKAYPRIELVPLHKDWRVQIRPHREYHWVYFESPNIAVCAGRVSGNLEPIRADAERFNALLKNPVPIEVRE